MSLQADTSGNNWQAWSVKLPIAVLAMLITVLWQGFELHSKIHENEYDIERVEGRLDKKAERLDERVKQIEDKIHSFECP